MFVNFTDFLLSSLLCLSRCFRLGFWAFRLSRAQHNSRVERRGDGGDEVNYYLCDFHEIFIKFCANKRMDLAKS